MSDTTPETPTCPNCNGTGGVDSGGITPWGEWITIPCPACQKAETPTAGQDGEDIICPFCGESDFDRDGLKRHYIEGWCAKAPELGGFYDPITERDTFASQLAQAQEEVETLNQDKQDSAREFTEMVNALRDELTASREECERLKNDYYIQGERLAAEIEHSERQKEEYGKALEHINWLYCRGYDPKPRPEWVKEALAKHQQADS